MLALVNVIRAHIGKPTTLAVTAALLYLPFSQRSLMLMGKDNRKRAGNI
jgi:hypothetical protein